MFNSLVFFTLQNYLLCITPCLNTYYNPVTTRKNCLSDGGIHCKKSIK